MLLFVEVCLFRSVFELEVMQGLAYTCFPYIDMDCGSSKGKHNSLQLSKGPVFHH